MACKCSFIDHNEIGSQKYAECETKPRFHAGAIGFHWSINKGADLGKVYDLFHKLWTALWTDSAHAHAVENVFTTT